MPEFVCFVKYLGKNICIFIRETLKPVEGFVKRCDISLYIEAKMIQL